MKALLIAVSLAVVANAQTAGEQRFEVVSIRVAAPRNPDPYVGPRTGGPGTSDPGRFTWEYAPPLSILVNAFGLGAFQIVGSGLEEERYDITAKVPAGTTADGLNVMLQNLLIDRLGLKFHHESRVMAVYELTVAKNGPKLKESDGSVAESGARYTNGVMRLTLARSTIGWLAGQLGVELERNVIDKTGLKGAYDFQLEYSHEGLRPFPGAPASVPGNAPSLFTAVQEQLGLKLEAAKEPVDVLVIDQINKTPTDN
jgi:uncharacterized protein (TIGR03435 family)